MIGDPHSLEDDDEELGYTREVQYCPGCKLLQK